MTPERWHQVEEIFHAALARGEGERPAFLAYTCAGDLALRREVEKLLALQGSSNFLNSPTVAATTTVSDAGPSLLTGRRLGGYEVHERIGVGGMGEVYRARDTKLGRDVAIKILPRLFTSDADRLARFEREARVLASLNHPHIGAIYGLEDANEVRALVLELVEGETLADRIAHGPIRLTEALTIARQIADALEAAHEKGIIHRDLKPANIKITPGGVVKVLDFGLARIVSHDSTLDSRRPTITVEGTREGLVMGTAPYMSPEQARGQTVDKRTDVWAFGCVLYEMLTARQAFDGETISDVLAKVIEREPDWSMLPASTLPRLSELLRRCLKKDPKMRLQAIGDARIQIEELMSGATEDTTTPVAVHPGLQRSNRVALIVATLSLLIAAALAIPATLYFRRAAPELWAPWRPVPEPLRTVRFDVFAPGGARIAPGDPLSPDGRTLAFVADSEGTPLIWIRPIDSSAAQPLPGTENAAGIFWSPDSQNIGFFAQGQLKRVAARGGPPIVICDQPGPDGSWGKDNVILIGEIWGPQARPLLRVAAAGGQPTPAIEFSGKEISHHFPSFLPDGRHFLYVARSNTSTQERLWYVGSLDTKERYPLAGLSGQEGAVKYSPTGHLVFVRGTTLMAQPFDLTRFELSGVPVPVSEQATEGRPAFSISNGHLSYLSGGVDSELAWFDRTGKPLGLAGPKGHYRNPELSPDSKFVAFGRAQPSDLWVRDIERGLNTRLTFHDAADHTPIWSPDRKNLAFFSARERGTLFVLAVGVIAEDTLLLEGLMGPIPGDWSRDGQYLIYQSGGDVWALPYPATGESKPLRVTQSAFTESNPRLSPDGRWIAYTSDQSGRQADVYIQSFLQPGLQQQVSTAGGQTARWSADGKELFYIAPDFALMAVPIALVGSSLRVGTPIRLFQTRMSTGGLGRNYNVAADGRFLINVTATDLSAAPITVILNWAAGL